MSRVDNRGVGPAAGGAPLYQDVAELQGLQSELDRRVAATSGAPRGATPDARIRFWGRPPMGDGPVPPPPLPAELAARPDGRDLQQLLRRALQAHRSPDRDIPPGEGERKMLGALGRLIDAQDRVALRLAKLTKA